MRLSVSLAILTGILYLATAHQLWRDPATTVVATKAFSPCLSDEEVSAALKTIYGPSTYSQQEHSLTTLRANARTSKICRKHIIAAFMTAMKNSSKELSADRSTFYLWHSGTEFLAEFKAVEALDLLISHFDLDDGTPFPLDHHPALIAVIKIGDASIPRLELLLKDPDVRMRKYAVFCLAQIGGTSAKSVLQQSAKSEAEPCVAAFIRTSLVAFNNQVLPNHITSKDRTNWYSTFLCGTTDWKIREMHKNEKL